MHFSISMNFKHKPMEPSPWVREKEKPKAVEIHGEEKCEWKYSDLDRTVRTPLSRCVEIKNDLKWLLWIYLCSGTGEGAGRKVFLNPVLVTWLMTGTQDDNQYALKIKHKWTYLWTVIPIKYCGGKLYLSPSPSKTYTHFIYLLFIYYFVVRTQHEVYSLAEF